MDTRRRRDRQPLFAVKCKSGERDVSPAIRCFAERTFPRFLQVHLGDRHFETGKVTVPGDASIILICLP